MPSNKSEIYLKTYSEEEKQDNDEIITVTAFGCLPEMFITEPDINYKVVCSMVLYPKMSTERLYTTHKDLVECYLQASLQITNKFLFCVEIVNIENEEFLFLNAIYIDDNHKIFIIDDNVLNILWSIITGLYEKKCEGYFDINKVSKLPENGYVYFARSKNDIKIGYSKNPVQRVKDLRTANPHVQLLGYIPGTQQLEKELHKQFQKYNINGEWFKLSKEIKTYIGNSDLTV